MVTFLNIPVHRSLILCSGSLSSNVILAFDLAVQGTNESAEEWKMALVEMIVLTTLKVSSGRVDLLEWRWLVEMSLSME